MKRLFKCRKALSPVVAAIILIAVTVAVSIAVAAWMGALTFTFMKTEELKVISYTWSGTTYIDLKVRNTGSSSLTMNSAEVNSGAPTAYDLDTGTTGNQTSNVSVSPGSEKTVRIWHSYTSGVKYEFAIVTAAGNRYTYTSTAP